MSLVQRSSGSDDSGGFSGLDLTGWRPKWPVPRNSGGLPMDRLNLVDPDLYLDGVPRNYFSMAS